jgi:hypothetical protein
VTCSGRRREGSRVANAVAWSKQWGLREAAPLLEVAMVATP